jgi:hypothetical protein
MTKPCYGVFCQARTRTDIQSQRAPRRVTTLHLVQPAAMEFFVKPELGRIFNRKEHRAVLQPFIWCSLLFDRPVD